VDIAHLGAAVAPHRSGYGRQFPSQACPSADGKPANDYPHLVALLEDAAALLPGDDWQPLLTAIRETHARKSKLMALLLQAGL